MVIEQARGIARSRGEEAVHELRRFVEEAKQSGFVARALERHAVQGAEAAPAA